MLSPGREVARVGSVDLHEEVSLVASHPGSYVVSDL